jgi:hypothetical protein
MIRYHPITYSTTSAHAVGSIINDAVVQQKKGGVNAVEKWTTRNATLGNTQKMALSMKMALSIKKHPADYPQAGPEVQRLPNPQNLRHPSVVAPRTHRLLRTENLRHLNHLNHHSQPPVGDWCPDETCRPTCLMNELSRSTTRRNNPPMRPTDNVDDEQDTATRLLQPPRFQYIPSNLIQSMPSTTMQRCVALPVSKSTM